MENSINIPEGIMKCSVDTLKQTVSEAMTRFDDYQQIFADLNKPLLVDYFNKAYNDIEKTYFTLKKGDSVNKHSRNEIRMLIKYAEKHANHEIWHTCTQCGYEYDLRASMACPKCGMSYSFKN